MARGGGRRALLLWRACPLLSGFLFACLLLTCCPVFLSYYLVTCISCVLCTLDLADSTRPCLFAPCLCVYSFHGSCLFAACTVCCNTIVVSSSLFFPPPLFSPSPHLPRLFMSYFTSRLYLFPHRHTSLYRPHKQMKPTSKPRNEKL